MTPPPTERQRACPMCGSEMPYTVITEHGTETATTRYMGWWCSDCAAGYIECADCGDLHHPDVECLPTREQRLAQVWDEAAGMVALPSGERVSIEECAVDAARDHAVYRAANACPQCGGPLEYFLEKHTPPVTQSETPPAEWRAYAECCTSTGDQCDYRRP